MKWNRVLQKGDVAFLVNEEDTQYAVVRGYDPTQPEDQQWKYAIEYFCHWKDSLERKIECLQNALDCYRAKTERNYISRFRLAELATRFKDCCEEEEYYEDVIDDMEDYEKEFFGICQEEDDE